MRPEGRAEESYSVPADSGGIVVHGAEAGQGRCYGAFGVHCFDDVSVRFVSVQPMFDFGSRPFQTQAVWPEDHKVNTSILENRHVFSVK